MMERKKTRWLVQMLACCLRIEIFAGVPGIVPESVVACVCGHACERESNSRHSSSHPPFICSFGLHLHH